MYQFFEKRFAFLSETRKNELNRVFGLFRAKFSVKNKLSNFEVKSKNQLKESFVVSKKCLGNKAKIKRNPEIRKNEKSILKKIETFKVEKSVNISSNKTGLGQVSNSKPDKPIASLNGNLVFKNALKRPKC